MKNYLLFLFLFLYINNGFLLAQAETTKTSIELEMEIYKLELKTEHLEKENNELKSKLEKIKDNTALTAKDISNVKGEVNAQSTAINLFAIIAGIIGGLLTLVVLILSFKAKGEAKTEAIKTANEILDKWLDEKAEKELNSRVEILLKEIDEKGKSTLDEMITKYKSELDSFKQKGNKVIQDILDLVKDPDKIKNLTDKQKEEIEVASEELKKTKKEKDYTFDDWYFESLSSNIANKYDEALSFINKAIQKANTQEETALSTFYKGYLYGEQGKITEAIMSYDEVINRFSESKNEEILSTVANALFNKGNDLGRERQHEESIKMYDEVISRFSESKNKNILLIFAKTLVNKGNLLREQDQITEAIVSFDELLNRFSKSKDEDFQLAVAKAFSIKAHILGMKGKHDESIKMYDEVINRFSENKDKEIKLAVAGALYNKGLELEDKGKHDESIKMCDEVINRFSESKNKEIQTAVARALGNKFESLLTRNQNFSNDDISLYKKLFGKDKTQMIELEMLQILYNSQNNSQEDEINAFQKYYKGITLKSWSFEDLDNWANTLKDKKVKQRIEKYIMIFKSFAAK